MHVLGLLDLEFVVVEEGLGVEVPQEHHGYYGEDHDADDREDDVEGAI